MSEHLIKYDTCVIFGFIHPPFEAPNMRFFTISLILATVGFSLHGQQTAPSAVTLAPSNHLTAQRLNLLADFRRLPAAHLDPELIGWRWLEHADTLNKKRFWTSVGIGAAIYGTAVYALYMTWYKDYEFSRFRTFNDAREWNQMDKMGHLLTTYSETRLLYDGARWTGLDKKRSLWLAGGIGMFLQGTLEVMDGYSEKWGFSWSDIGFNTIGMAAFVSQEAIWDEQRIIFKLSGNRTDPPDLQVASSNGEGVASLVARSRELYGQSIPERLLKDYNTMTVWGSVNVRAFAPESRWPRWLNVAVGYGAGNLYGGFGNSWTDEAGLSYQLPAADFPRYRQLYLSFDIDLKRIPVRRRWLKSALSILNFLKFPAPALEWNTLGKVRFHPLYF